MAVIATSMANIAPAQLPLWLSYVEPATSLLTVIGGGFLAWAAIKQASNSTRQAKTASERHEAQTNADRQRNEAQAYADRERRITENFARAADQLGSEKMAVRLGGIYILERISRESWFDYWAVIETLTAFVREQSNSYRVDNDIASKQFKFQELFGGEELFLIKPPTDIAAVLSVIFRRSEEAKEHEKLKGLVLDFTGADFSGFDLNNVDLRGFDLSSSNLSGTNLRKASLGGTCLRNTNLSGASLHCANLDSAILSGATLTKANLSYAHLKRAHLENADLTEAILSGAKFDTANLGNANLTGAKCPLTKFPNAHFFQTNVTNADLAACDLSEKQLENTIGNAATHFLSQAARSSQ
jgi:uncharacterized protein YjbI with pentapeptide repeats